MDGCLGCQDIKALQNLISPPIDNSDSEDDLPQAGARKLCFSGPSDIGAQTVANGAPENAGPHGPLKEGPDDIWHPSEADKAQYSETCDPREVPEYEMKFKQAVSAEDVFLGMGFKTPSTASCEWLAILVKMPQESRDRVELTVESDAIDVRSPRYRLHLATPHPVDPSVSSAKWHTDVSALEVTLKLVRELDAVNF
ncbi:dynein axonemal assembly factor 6 isoform X1 [Hylaeus volcanicus]|uniref:dynein axonemal assembly factor 6 isoform X1 n=1 Tax=Hylaeus volcanicus TaxID=313075 RepID=UPI0023B81C89|nr:dynein axonemal assembly factor 6 isoform X1 [Hylaeus volcanicus]XP_053987313.1 dynein axonemal assembly factor 6 isoform X1 [Hylaeus volcanicus]